MHELKDITKSDVLAFASELSTLGDWAWVHLLTYVNEIDFTGLGDSNQTVRMARIFLAAHLGLLNQRSATGAAGPVISESAGGLRRSYSQVSSSSTIDLNSTMYGQLYLSIIGSSLAHGPLVV